jgi:ligand-binding SRPBCC domain-containing protein
MHRIHIFERRQRVELPIEEAFAFYGDARNLERITPPWLGFEVTTPAPIEIGAGTLIEDRVRYSIPFGPLGAPADRLLVRRDLRRIFDYRRVAVAREIGRTSCVVRGGPSGR